MGVANSFFEKCKRQAIAESVPTFFVVIDYLWARMAYGFCGEDYFLNSGGYSLKNYLKKDFFSHKRWIRVRKLFNDERYTGILQNKIKTLQLFEKYIHHEWLDLNDCSFEQFESFVKRHNKLLLKPVNEEGGKGISVYSPSGSLLVDYQKLNGGGYMLEEYINQSVLMRFNNNSVNTIRVYSILDVEGKVHIIKALLRAGVGESVVDNFHSGGVFYPINIEEGFIEQYGEQRASKKPLFIHPGSDIVMLGYTIPHWNELVRTVEEMALLIPKVRYIGWDMVVTEDGVDLIEANDNADHAMFGRFGINRLYYNQIKSYL